MRLVRNEAAAPITKYTYDHRNLLTKVIVEDLAGDEIKSVDYLYDVLGRRLGKEIDTDADNTADEVEYYTHEGAQIALQHDDSDVTKRNLWGPAVDQLLAVEEIDPTDNDVLWTLADHQGTIREIFGLDDQATYKVLDTIDYDGHGRPLSDNTDGPTVDFGFQGLQFDFETGLNYNRARYYDPTAQGFISEDPLGFVAGDTNFYRRGGNSFANATDPSGLYTVSDYWAGTKAFFGSIGSNLYNGPRSLVTGEAGEAIGNRVVAISQRHGDGRFDGGLNDWANFAYYATGEIIGGNAIYEATAGVDLATGQQLSGYERFMRGVQGVTTAAGWAAGGTGLAARLAPARFGWATTTALPGSTVASQVAAPLSRAVAPITNTVGSSLGAATRLLPQSFRNAASATGRVLGTDVRDLARGAFSRYNNSGPQSTAGLTQRSPTWDAYPASLSGRLAAYKQWKANAGISGTPTTSQFNRFAGAHRPGSRGSTLYYDRSGFAKWARQVEGVHGNTAGSQAAWLYRLESNTGELLKWGVSQDPYSRYSATFMRGKRIVPVQQGPRRHILDIERDLVERTPGPWNHERWAGSRLGA